MHEFQCYDCGKMVGEDQVCRRDMVTGRGGHGNSSWSQETRVNLCPACAEKHDAEERAGDRQFWIAILAFIGAIGLVIVIAWLSGRIWPGP